MFLHQVFSHLSRRQSVDFLRHLLQGLRHCRGRVRVCQRHRSGAVVEGGLQGQADAGPEAHGVKDTGGRAGQPKDAIGPEN